MICAIQLFTVFSLPKIRTPAVQQGNFSFFLRRSFNFGGPVHQNHNFQQDRGYFLQNRGNDRSGDPGSGGSGRNFKGEHGNSRNGNRNSGD